MASKFRGTETVKVDGKGRMSIPSAFRQIFDQNDPAFASANTGRTRLIAVYGPDWWNWIELYSMTAIDRMDEKIDAMEDGSVERRWLEELMNAQSTNLEIDREGRLVLPQRMREKLGLGENTESIMKSRGDYLQVYHPDSLPKDTEALQKVMDQYGPEFDPRVMLSGRKVAAEPPATEG